MCRFLIPPPAMLAVRGRFLAWFPFYGIALGAQQGVRSRIRKWYKRVSRAFEGMCVQKKGMRHFIFSLDSRRVEHLVLSVACGTNTRAYLIEK